MYLLLLFKYPASHPPLHCTNTLPVISCLLSLPDLTRPAAPPPPSALTAPSRRWATPGQCFIPGELLPCACEWLCYKRSPSLSCKLSSTHDFKRYVLNVSVIWEEGISSLLQVGEWKNQESKWLIWEYLVRVIEIWKKKSTLRIFMLRLHLYHHSQAYGTKQTVESVQTAWGHSHNAVQAALV